MTGKDLLMTLGTIDEAFYKEAEMPIPSRRKLIAIAVLVAVLLLLAGCSYAVLTQAQWFQSFFGRLNDQPLSQGQTAYIEENVQPIGGQSVTVGHYRLTLESALAEERTACIRLRLEGPGLREMYSVGFLPRPLADGTGKEAVFSGREERHRRKVPTSRACVLRYRKGTVFPFCSGWSSPLLRKRPSRPECPIFCI